MLNIIGKYKNIIGKKAREEETELKILVHVEFCTSNGDTSYIWENQNTKDLHLGNEQSSAVNHHNNVKHIVPCISCC